MSTVLFEHLCMMLYKGSTTTVTKTTRKVSSILSAQKVSWNQAQKKLLETSIKAKMTKKYKRQLYQRPFKKLQGMEWPSFICRRITQDLVC